MNQVDSLKKLKSIKRKTKADYNCLRAIYINKLTDSLNADKKIFYEAIIALDNMFRAYELMRGAMRSLGFIEQIKFIEKLDTYISCIESLTAHRTKDKYLLNYLTIVDETHARQTATVIWRDFQNLIAQKRKFI